MLTKLRAAESAHATAAAALQVLFQTTAVSWYYFNLRFQKKT
jgi:hypothetical protein